MINANQHPETGEVSRDASANGGSIQDFWHEERKTDGRNSTDLVYDARCKRTNRMAHRQAKPQGKDVGYGHGHTVFAERLD